MGDNRKVERTRYPGIYRVSRGGRPDKYMVSYRIRGLPQRTRTLPTLREAKQFQASVRDPVRAEELRKLTRGSITIGDYFPLFVERRRTLTPTTRARYESVGRLYIQKGRLAGLLLASVTRDDVESWVTDMEAAGIGPGSIDKAYRTLRAMLEAATAEGRILSNPARRISTPPSRDRDPFFLTAAQVDVIANEVPARHRALVYLLAYGGLRIGEASALRVRNLDLPARKITIAESSAEVGGRKVGGQTKTRRKRTLDLSDALATELAAHLDEFGPRTSPGELDPNGFLFSHAHGGQIRQNNWRARVFQPACIRAGVFRIRADGGPHEAPRVQDLRHTAASLAARAGYSLHEVKEMLGHSTIKTTSDRYLHLFPDAKREKAERLGEIMTGARERDGGVVALPKQWGERPARSEEQSQQSEETG